MICVNPGSGPVADSSETEAILNIRAFVSDLGLDGVEIKRKPKKDDGDGRLCFILTRGRRKARVDMPGLSLERVRWLENTGQNPWYYPRLYTNGNSWLWAFALRDVRISLQTKTERKEST